MSVKRYYNSFIMSGQMIESEDGAYVLHSDYAALLARHNALRYNTKVIIKAYRENRTRHNALLEAVAWERECEIIRFNRYKYKAVPFSNAVQSRNTICAAARAAVDALVEEG